MACAVLSTTDVTLLEDHGNEGARTHAPAPRRGVGWLAGADARQPAVTSLGTAASSVRV